MEEREFSVELYIRMKRYCWRELRAKIVAIVKLKMQLVLGKKNTLEMNEFTENKCLPKLESKFNILENFRKLLALKSTG